MYERKMCTMAWSVQIKWPLGGAIHAHAAFFSRPEILQQQSGSENEKISRYSGLFQVIVIMRIRTS